MVKSIETSRLRAECYITWKTEDLGDGGGVIVVALALPILLLHSSRTDLIDKTTQMIGKRQVSAGEKGTLRRGLASHRQLCKRRRDTCTCFPASVRTGDLAIQMLQGNEFLILSTLMFGSGLPKTISPQMKVLRSEFMLRESRTWLRPSWGDIFRHRRAGIPTSRFGW